MLLQLPPAEYMLTPGSRKQVYWMPGTARLTLLLHPSNRHLQSTRCPKAAAPSLLACPSRQTQTGHVTCPAAQVRPAAALCNTLYCSSMCVAWSLLRFGTFGTVDIDC
jgi:hypothetical protein